MMKTPEEIKKSFHAQIENLGYGIDGIPEEYESPIQLNLMEFSKIIYEKFENDIMCEIQQKFGVCGSKEDLIKALNYDRNQYVKGFEDGKKATVTHGMWVESTNYMIEKCSKCGYGKYGDWQMNFCPNCGAKMDMKREEEE